MPFYRNQHTDGPTYSYDDLVRATRTLGAELGRSPTTREAVADERFPCLAAIYRLADDGWAGVLADADLEPTQVRAYGSDEGPKMCADLRRVHDVVGTPRLTHRQYDAHGTYPTSVVKEYFGSWRAACDAAGLDAGEKHGTSCTGPRGESLDSQYERAVATRLHDAGLGYVVHPRVEGTRWIGDFYLPAVDLWVEVDGYAPGTRPNADGFAAKLRHLREAGDDVAVVRTPDDLVRALRERGVDLD